MLKALVCRALLPQEAPQLVLRPLLSGPTATIHAERLVHLTVCYSWGCPSSVLAGTAPCLQSSVPGTANLPLQREKPSVTDPGWKETHPTRHTGGEAQSSVRQCCLPRCGTADSQIRLLSGSWVATPAIFMTNLVPPWTTGIHRASRGFLARWPQSPLRCRAEISY